MTSATHRRQMDRRIWDLQSRYSAAIVVISAIVVKMGGLVLTRLTRYCKFNINGPASKLKQVQYERELNWLLKHKATSGVFSGAEYGNDNKALLEKCVRMQLSCSVCVSLSACGV
ncbi:hypothetical protein ABVT39_014619 [Epinephelus coioides]